MNSASPLLIPATSAPEALEACPLNHGLAVLDQLLAAITREPDAAALDAVLDFRLLLARSDDDAETILQTFFQIRRLVEERHYLACFRFRRWLEGEYQAEVKLDRTQPVRPIPLRLDVATYLDLCARCAFDAAAGELLTAWVRVSFAKVTTPVLRAA